jgi:predicted SPOUT superfamily RNA methylase MTH1
MQIFIKTIFKIARAATLFCIDEIIVYNEFSSVETEYCFNFIYF